MTRIIIFGDSITYGAYDKEGGWADRLKGFVHGKDLSDPDYHCMIYNLGVSGDTSEDLLERFEFETRMRMKEGEETVFIFSVGGNDSQFLKSRNSQNVSPEKFQENIQRLIDLAGKISKKIVFVGLTPMVESKTTPIPWDTDKTYKNEYLKRYNDILKSVCESNRVHFIELFGKLVGTDYDKSLEDGVHPNTVGHEKIFEIVRDFLTVNNII